MEHAKNEIGAREHICPLCNYTYVEKILDCEQKWENKIYLCIKCRAQMSAMYHWFKIDEAKGT